VRSIVRLRGSLLAAYLIVFGASCMLPDVSVSSSSRREIKGAGRKAEPRAGAGGASGTEAGVSGADADSTGTEAGASGADAGASGMRADIEAHCGDGRVSGNEKCDIGISGETSGRCPTSCPDLAPCNPRALNNSGCQAECVLLQMVCMAGDGCCPGNCTEKNDSDCSSNCGDGVVQTETGETCEAGSTTPCKMSVAECDDQDACTVDKLIGSAKNCNASCMNTKITAPRGGDGCCLAGSDANSDTDCKPICGNRVREPGEDCDGSAGCNASCKLALLPDQVQCLEKFGNAGDACAKCSCMNCASSYLLCRDSPDATLNTLCNDVLECSVSAECYGAACYCGDSLFCSSPNGPCRAQIEAAAGSTLSDVVNTRSSDINYASGRANAADMCRAQQCVAECN